MKRSLWLSLLSPNPPSPSLTPCALQIKERVYEPALAWQRWWGVITVERLSCSLRTLPLSSLGQEHEAKKKRRKKLKRRERVKLQWYWRCYHCSIVVLLWVNVRWGLGRWQPVSVLLMWSWEKLIFCWYYCILAASSLLQLLALYYDGAHTIKVKAVS